MAKPLLLGSMATAALLLGVWLAVGRGAADDSERALASVAQEKGEAGPASALRFHPEPGRRYVYAFERKLSFSGLGRIAFPPVSYHGHFYVDVIRAGQESFEAVLSERIVEAAGKTSPLLRAKVSATGEQLELFQGALEGDEEIQHANILRDLASNWVFPLPSDTAGTYSSTIESLPAVSGEPRLRKVKLAYTGKSPNLPEILSSLHFLRWENRLSLPAEIQGRESTRLGRKGPTLDAESSYHFLFRAAEPLPAYHATTLAGLKTPSSLAPGKIAAGSHPEYAKLDWRTIMANLRALEQMPAVRQLDVFADLLKYLQLHPEKLAEAGQLLRSPELLRKGPLSPLFKTLVGALASLGSPEAQNTLREAYADPTCAVSCKGTILSAFTTTQATLDPPTRDFLAQEMQAGSNHDLAQGAAFALGSSLQNAPAGDPGAASAIGIILGAWKAESQAQNTAELLALLDVMGNSGRAEFLPAVEAALGSSDTSVRARATFALRFMNTDQSARDLVRGLADSDARVRLAAASAMGFANWTELFRSPLGACGNGDISEQVRTTCRATLTQNSGQMAAGN